MKKNIRKAVVLLFFFSGIIGLSTYFVKATQIEGSTPESNAVSSEENKDATVVTTSAAETEAAQETTANSSIAEEAQTAASEPEVQPVEPQRETEVYTVQQGQNLWEIAQQSGMSLQDLMNMNQLSSSAIFTGQELLLAK